MTSSIEQVRGKQPVTAVFSLVMGILSILSLGSISDNSALATTVTTLLGLTAIGLAILAYRKNKNRKMWISGLVMGGIAVMTKVAALLLFLIFSVIGSVGSGGEYNKSLNALESLPKVFTKNEVAKVGHYLVTVKDVQANYTPSDSDFAKLFLLKSSRLYGLDIEESSAKYVRITLNIKYKEDPSILGLQFDNYFTEGIANARLNDVWAIAIYPDSTYNKNNSVLEGSETEKGLDRTYVFRIPKSSQNMDLTFFTSVYTVVNPIVGTEGMPSESYTYTIKL